MTLNAQGVIQGIIRATDSGQEAESEGTRKPVITISRGMGSGGNEIAAQLAERLGVECFGDKILDSVAKSADVDDKLMSELHERVANSSDSWLYALVFGKNVTKDDYLHRLVTTVRGLYWQGGVILGRGGAVILSGRDVLRLRVIGSVDACAKRIAIQEGIELGEAKKMVRESNKKREKFAKKMFGVNPSDPTLYDLVINTDHFPHYNVVTDLIMNTVQAMGLDKPRKGTTNK